MLSQWKHHFVFVILIENQAHAMQVPHIHCPTQYSVKNLAFSKMMNAMHRPAESMDEIEAVLEKKRHKKSKTMTDESVPYQVNTFSFKLGSPLYKPLGLLSRCPRIRWLRSPSAGLRSTSGLLARVLGHVASLVASVFYLEC